MQEPTKTLVRVFDWVLLLAPIVAAENCHAKRCDAVVSLWNESIVIEDPNLAVSIWIGLVAIRTTANIVSVEGQCSPGEGQCSSRLARNYRVWILLYMTLVHFAVLYAGMRVCVYTTPLCFTCIEGTMQLISYCSMYDRNIRH